MPGDWIIRQAIESDAPIVAQLLIASFRAGFSGLVAQSWIDALHADALANDWRERIARGPMTALLAGNPEPAGFAAFEPFMELPRRWELTRLYVAPQWWRTGCGRALCRSVQERVLAAGGDSLHLWVLDANHRARGFYEAIGFAADGGSKIIDCDGPLLHLRYTWHAP